MLFIIRSLVFKGIFLPFALAILVSNSAFSQEEGLDCFSILVGKDASFDGSVLFAHNEDDFGKQFLNWYYMPRSKRKAFHEVQLENGGSYSLNKQVAGYLWLNLPGMRYGDSYMNEYGVVISSNACSSKEDQPEITDGGIGYRLREIMASQARTAKDAVKIGAELIERFGYISSGRTYCIADSKEAWTLAVVKGKHWVAQRVPDDEIVMVPNYYTIDEIDLSDTLNFLGSDDLISYAINRNWYSEEDGDFSFRKTYAPANSLKHPGNINRHWGALYLIGDKNYDIGDVFPFSFKPDKKISREELIEVLQFHYEGTFLDKTDGYRLGNPYKLNGSTICSNSTRYAFIAQLRDWLQVDIGSVLWVAAQRPTTQIFVPWYAGVNKVPGRYNKALVGIGYKKHFKKPKNRYKSNRYYAFWRFLKLSDVVDSNYKEYISLIAPEVNTMQNDLFLEQLEFENAIMKVYTSKPQKVQSLLNLYTLSKAKLALKWTEQKIKLIEK